MDVRPERRTQRVVVACVAKAGQHPGSQEGMLDTLDRDVLVAFRTGQFQLHRPVLVVVVGSGTQPRGSVPDIAQTRFEVNVQLLVSGNTPSQHALYARRTPLAP